MESRKEDYLENVIRKIAEEVGISNSELNLFISESRIDELSTVIVDKIRALKAGKANVITSNDDGTRVDDDAWGWNIYQLNIPDTSIVDSLDAPLFIHTLENWSPDISMVSLCC